MDESKVEIAIAPDQIEIKETEDQTPSPQQEVQADLSTNPQELSTTELKIKCLVDGCDMSFTSSQEFEEHKKKTHEKPQRDELGHFLPGNQESVGDQNTGRPCGFCQNRTHFMSKFNLYLQFCRGKVDGKLHIPYLEDIADDLDLLTETIYDWMNNERHKEQHSELVHTVKKMKQMQRSRLLRRTLAESPTGAIFQLKANHGFIETEKRMLVGDKDAPVETVIRIVEEKPLPENN